MAGEEGVQRASPRQSLQWVGVLDLEPVAPKRRVVHPRWVGVRRLEKTEVVLPRFVHPWDPGRLQGVEAMEDPGPVETLEEVAEEGVDYMEEAEDPPFKPQALYPEVEVLRMVKPLPYRFWSLQRISVAKPPMKMFIPTSFLTPWPWPFTATINRPEMDRSKQGKEVVEVNMCCIVQPSVIICPTDKRIVPIFLNVLRIRVPTEPRVSTVLVRTAVSAPLDSVALAVKPTLTNALRLPVAMEALVWMVITVTRARVSRGTRDCNVIPTSMSVLRHRVVMAARAWMVSMVTRVPAWPDGVDCSVIPISTSALQRLV